MSSNQLQVSTFSNAPISQQTTTSWPISDDSRQTFVNNQHTEESLLFRPQQAPRELGWVENWVSSIANGEGISGWIYDKVFDLGGWLVLGNEYVPSAEARENQKEREESRQLEAQYVRRQREERQLRREQREERQQQSVIENPTLVIIDDVVKEGLASKIQGPLEGGRTGASVAAIESSSNPSRQDLFIGTPGENDYDLHGDRVPNGRADIVPADNLFSDPDRYQVSLLDVASTTFTSDRAINAAFSVKSAGDMDLNGEPDLLLAAQNRTDPHSTVLLYNVNTTKKQTIDLDTIQEGEGTYLYQKSLGTDPIYPYVELDRTLAPAGPIFGQDAPAGLAIPSCEDFTESHQDADSYAEDNLLFLAAKEGGYPLNLELSGVKLGQDATMVHPLEDSYSRFGEEPRYTIANAGDLLGGTSDATLIGMPLTMFSGRYCEDGMLPEGKVILVAGQDRNGTIPQKLKHTNRYIEENGLTFWGGELNAHAGKAIVASTLNENGKPSFDSNCDGEGDLAISSPHSGDFNYLPTVSVLFGPFTRERFPGDYTNLTNITPQQGVTYVGECFGDHTGFSLAPAGNFNGATYPDGSPCYGGLVIGTKGGNKFYVVYPNTNPPAKVDLANLQPGQGTKFIMNDKNADLGFSVASGLVTPNSDYTALVVGAPGRSTDTGNVFVIPGGKELPQATRAAEPCNPVPPPSPSPTCPPPTPHHTLHPSPTTAPTPSTSTPSPASAPTPSSSNNNHFPFWAKATIAGVATVAAVTGVAIGIHRCRNEQEEGNGEEREFLRPQGSVN